MQVHRIEKYHLRILWVNWAAPSLGDSVMDLSSRILLKGRYVDLVTHPKNANLYTDDDVFRNVTGDLREARTWTSSKSYDLVIVDSFSPRVMSVKNKIARNVPFVGLYGFLNGFEIHRIYYSFARMERLLNISIPTEQRIPRLVVNASVNASSIALFPTSRTLAVAIGGEWRFRTYHAWREVIEPLITQYRIVLFGSDNGVLEAKELEASFPTAVNFVGKLSLKQTMCELKGCDFFVGADGGLWHISSALGLPSVCLFADCELFDEQRDRVLRNTSDQQCVTLYADVAVEQIDPSDVLKAIEQMIEQYG